MLARIDYSIDRDNRDDWEHQPAIGETIQNL